MVLIDWIDQLHSSPSVNIIHCMPRFLLKFLSVIETQEGEAAAGTNQSNDLGKKARDQLRHFLQDLRDPNQRILQLDREVICKLTEFLMKTDHTKRNALNDSLEWLNYFVDFFREDFQALTDQAAQMRGHEEFKEERLG